MLASNLEWPRSRIALALIGAGLLLLTARTRCAAQEEETEPPAASAPETTEPPLHESDLPPLASGMKVEGPAAATLRREAAARATPTAEQSTTAEVAPAKPSPAQRGGLSYTVRPGDSLSAIAQLYGLDVTDLAHANRLSDDAVLQVDQVLKIPNPFAAQVRHLQATVQQLTIEQESATHKASADAAQIKALTEQLDQLQAGNRELEHDVRVLPWWRGLALSAGAGALLMLGVTALTMLEWLMLRRRFRALVEMNEAIRRLDQKYKVALAKAELRLQQLYGRRRAVAEDEDKLGSPEEIEIDRLNQQLKELLQEHLERLGLSTERSGRRSRLREMVGGVESPVEARASRR